MAGSGHLQTFRLLRFLRSRNCADGQSSYGIQMAVSSASCPFFSHYLNLEIYEKLALELKTFRGMGIEIPHVRWRWTFDTIMPKAKA